MYPTFTTSSTSTTSTPEKNKTFNSKLSPSKSAKRGSAPVMSSGEKKNQTIPKLSLTSEEIISIDTTSPYKSTHRINLSPRKDATQSPRSPRAYEDERPPSSRQHIKSPSTATNSSTTTSPQKRDLSSRASAPPKMIVAMDIDRSDLKLNELSVYFSQAWIKAAKAAASKPKANAKSSDNATLTSPTGKAILSESIIRSISRSECQLSKSEMHPDLLALLPENNEKDVESHTVILKVLLGQSLRESVAGKTLLTMKRLAMESNPAFAQLSRQSIPEDEFKQDSIAGMQTQASAAVDMSFGVGARSLAASKLPAALINCWKLMDRELVEWAKGNPALSDELIQTARSNLGMDTIITRMIYPLIYGSPHEAHLLAPGWFGNAVRLNLVAAWPEFFADFVKQTEAESKISNENTSG